MGNDGDIQGIGPRIGRNAAVAVRHDETTSGSRTQERTAERPGRIARVGDAARCNRDESQTHDLRGIRNCVVGKVGFSDTKHAGNARD